MRTVLAWLLAGCACIGSALGMTVEVHGERIFATGYVGDQADFQAFRDALQQPGIKEVVFVNSPGGDLWTGMTVGRLIAEHKLRTLAVGYCMSACSIMFMGGDERQFAAGAAPLATMIGFHGAHRLDTGFVDPQLQSQLYAFYKLRFADKFDAELMGMALHDIVDRGGFLRVRDPQRNTTQNRRAFFCRSASMPFKDCRHFDGKDAYSLGVITSAQTVSVELPAAFRPRLVFFGRVFDTENGDAAEVTRSAGVQLCGDDRACAAKLGDAVAAWAGATASKAFALGADRPGYGYRHSAQDGMSASLGALASCNHSKGNPKLCRLVAIDGYLLGGLYDESSHQAAAALASLTRPATAAWADEDKGPALPPAQAYRSDGFDAVTPLKLAGVSTILTGELAERLAAEPRPLLIDVTRPSADMLPGALHFWNGGLAYKDEPADAAFDERFRNMLAVVAPAKSQPLVFYCLNRDCWLSANAALRASRAGYTQVRWYRGGLEAWKAAGLPLVQKVPSVAF